MRLLIYCINELEEVVIYFSVGQNDEHFKLQMQIFRFAWTRDSKKIEKVLKEIINKAIKEELILPESEYLGINDLGPSSVKYLIKINCDQNKKHQIKRDILEKVKIAYEKNNIKIPYNQIEVHHGQDI